MKRYEVDTSTGEAEADIEAIFSFIALDSPRNALRWYLNIKAKIQTLETMPERCPKAPENELAEFTVHHLIDGNYRVLFRINGKTVQVLHVRGGWQERKL